MSEQVVTRFAPSPTGYLHVGGARTALFNWLWAKHNQGKFLLRVEDTDQKRNTPTATQQVIKDLKWLGITWDEGPEVGGSNGPYFQSERLDIYEKYIQQLLDEGKAYYCFDTSEELDALRKEAETNKTGFITRRPDQLPTAEDLARARAEGRPVTIRFAIPQDHPIVVTDVVRGEVTFDPAEIADFIIKKSDGFPTYNFACVVDDYLMKVTHIIRGQEHLNNTPGQKVLWQALFGDDRLPQYAHMSVTVSDSGGKLSKRERPKTLRTAIKAMADVDLAAVAQVGGLTVEALKTFLDGTTTPDMPLIDAMAEHLGVHLPEINVVDFLKSGYLPETMVNFMALLGWNPGDNREIMSLDELIQCYDVTRLNKSNSLFDRAKLGSFNTEYMRTVPKETLVSHLRDYLVLNESPVANADDALLSQILDMCAGARTLADIDRKVRFAFVSDDAVQFDAKAVKKVLLKEGALDMLGIVRAKLEAMDSFTEDTLETMLRGLAEEKQVGLGKVAQPLRVAITGSTVSPSIFDSVNLLGKDVTLKRIDNTIAKFGEQN
ncbi:MAG: glutamate--tRNA ligase [Phycisphaerae bacterium]|nr:glutamate--tRNA ligase [Phycisphaerae bacterium]